MFRLHGLTPTDGQVDLELVRSLIDADDFSDLAKVLVGKQGPNELRYRIHRSDDGETRTLLTRGEIKRDEHGRIVRFSGASMDITAQLALEDQLRRGQKYFRALVESNIVGVLFTERDGRIIEANDAFLSLLGYSADDIPLIWEDLTSPDRMVRDESAREELQGTGVVLPYEKEFTSKTGEPVLMLIASARIDLETAMVITVDLSERQLAEAYISEYRKVLERTIAERTQELMESRDRLIENDRLAAVGTLAAGVAHQINNPIGAILNSAEYAMLCREERDAQAIFEQALLVNLTEARRCAQIVKSMLLFSRDEPTPRWQEDLRGVIRRAHRAIAPYAADRSAEVTVHINPTPILALISPIEIEQAIVNVLRNAIESRETGASILLSLFAQDKNAIIDDGRGIPKSERDRLFEPFFSTRTREGGTGLGLSVAHGILTDHGGEIRVESILDGGSRIVMSLPIA